MRMRRSGFSEILSAKVIDYFVTICRIAMNLPIGYVPKYASNMYMTRRNILSLVAVSGMSGFTALKAASKSSFWNDKDASHWSAEERQELVTDSPWAKQVRADATRAQPVGPPPSASPSSVPMRMPGSMSPSARGNASSFPAFTGTVRWESAKPILLALKKSLANEFEGHYVIGVSGFPLGLHNPQSNGHDPGTEAEQTEELKQVTTLRVKGKDPAQAGVISRSADAGGLLYLFGFSRDVIAIDKKDKNVIFETQFGPLDIEAKFEPKQMLYHGELAL